nr:E3 ubiquitin-protein ligase FANCL isoform X3 [Rattus norvegicus]
MADTEANLLRHFPLLLPQNREKTVYEGFISAQGRDFHLRIVLPKDQQLKKARLLCSWQLKNILNEYHQVVQQRMKHSPDLMSFMMELKIILEAALKNKQELYVQPPSCSFCKDLLTEIGAIGWDKLACVDTSFTTIKLKADDASGRKHLITVKLKAKEGLEATYNHPSIRPSVRPSIDPPTHPHTYSPTHLPTHPPTHLPNHFSCVCACVYVCVFVYTHVRTCLCACVLTVVVHTLKDKFGNPLSPSTTWVLWIELTMSGLRQALLSAEHLATHIFLKICDSLEEIDVYNTLRFCLSHFLT